MNPMPWQQDKWQQHAEVLLQHNKICKNKSIN